MEKAFTALALAVLEIIDLFWGTNWLGLLNEEIVGTIIALLIPILVFFVPNRET